MDYLADLPNMICSILELTTTRTAGRLRVVPLFSLLRGGGGGERTKPGLRGERGGWERTLRGRKMNWRVGNGTRRGGTGLGEGRNNDFEEDENGTLRRKKKGL